jgi:hypothetical protein
VVAEGAGHEMRRTLGMAVFAGMIGVTVFGLFLTPVFFYVVRGLVRGRAPAPVPAEDRDPAAHAIPPVEGAGPLKATSHG